jgi:hypothetical protein
MKAGIFFSGTGPILILTSYKELDDPELVKKLALKGIKKFIAYEVGATLVKEKYGQHFNVIRGDLQQEDDLRVLDYDGHHVFYNFSFAEMSDPIYHES